MMTALLIRFGAICPGGNFLFFPPWYKYLQDGGQGKNGLCQPKLTGINDIWLIVAALIEILLRVAALIAIGYIIRGGFEYVTSQAEPDKVAKARSTVVNALVGLVIALLSTAAINFVAGSVN